MKKLVLLIVAFPLGACVVPTPVVRLAPQGPDAVWVAGRAVVTRQVPPARIAVAFDHLDEQRVVFRVEVQNEGTAPFDVDPAQLSYRICTGPQSCAREYAVVNPERILVELDLRQADERARQESAQGLGTALLFLDVTAGVAAASSGAAAAVPTLARDGLLVASTTRADVVHHQVNRSVIATEKLSWLNEALRRTTLQPGQGLAGFVYVPVHPEATAVLLNVQAGGPETWFAFSQTTLTPAGPP